MKGRKLAFGIVGYGRFGRLWARELSRFGRVLVFEKKRLREKPPRGVSFRALAEVARADILFVAVPISRLEECLLTLKSLVPRGTVVVDVSSVKVFPARIMKKTFRKDQPLLGTHPLFGPDSARVQGGIKGLKIVVCRLRKGGAYEREVLSVFRKLKLAIIPATPEEHDRAMAHSQALVHFMGRALAGLKLTDQKIATPDYRTLLKMQDMVVNDTWQLFSDMQERNPFASEVREQFMENLERLDAEISSGNDPASLRRGIDRVDRGILTLLACRSTLSRSMGELKKARKLPVRDRARERALRTMRVGRARELDLDPSFTERLFADVVANSRGIQRSRSS